MSDKKKNTVAYQRQVQCYPHPVDLQKLNNYVEQTGQSKSSVLCEALRVYLSQKTIVSKNRY